jgi:hypothetical protein
MGTIMLCFTERKFFRRDDIEKQNGIWVSLDKWKKSDYALLYPEKKNALWHVEWNDLIFHGKLYDLQAILANQRNSENIPYLSVPRGLPSDVSEEIRQEYECGEYYTCTWYTLDEIFNYNWDQ